MNVLSCGPKASNISGISDAISPRYIRKNPRSMHARVQHMMAQFVLKNGGNFPYHGDSPNTRNGALTVSVPDYGSCQRSTSKNTQPNDNNNNFIIESVFLVFTNKN